MSEKIVVGIDVSKAFSDICILSPNNDIIKRMKISNDVIGMQSLISVLEKVENEYVLPEFYENSDTSRSFQC